MEAWQDVNKYTDICVPFIKTIGEGKDTVVSRYMKDTVFIIPTAKVLAKVVDGIDAMDMNIKDIICRCVHGYTCFYKDKFRWNR